MKIDLPVFKDEDTMDAVTYQSWRWDLTVELVWSLGMDITLDDVLTMLAEHYNNVKALDALNQELFQLWMVDKETILDWGIYLSRNLQVLAVPFSNHFPPNHVAEFK